MKAYSKEFYEIQEQFERDIKKMPVYVSNMKRTQKGTAPAGYFYDDGNVNNLFHAYMTGFESAKCLANMGAL